MIKKYAPLLSIFLIQGRTHCLRFLLSAICAFYITLAFCFDKRLFLKYFENDFKIL